MTSFDAIAAQFPFATKGQATGIDSPNAATDGKGSQFSLEFSAFADPVKQAGLGSATRHHAPNSFSNVGQQQARTVDTSREGLVALKRTSEGTSAKAPTLSGLAQLRDGGTQPHSSSSDKPSSGPNTGNQNIREKDDLQQAAQANSLTSSRTKETALSKISDVENDSDRKNEDAEIDVSLDLKSDSQSDQIQITSASASNATPPIREVEDASDSSEEDVASLTEAMDASEDIADAAVGLGPSEAVAPQLMNVGSQPLRQDASRVTTGAGAVEAAFPKGSDQRANATRDNQQPLSPSAVTTSAQQEPLQQENVSTVSLTDADKLAAHETDPSETALRTDTRQPPFTSISEARFALQNSTAIAANTVQTTATSGDIPLPEGMEQVAEQDIDLPPSVEESSDGDPALPSGPNASLRNIAHYKTTEDGEISASDAEKTLQTVTANTDSDGTDSPDATSTPISSSVNNSTNVAMQTTPASLLVTAQAQMGAEKYVAKRREVNEQLDEELAVTQIGKDKTAQSRTEASYAAKPLSGTTDTNVATGQPKAGDNPLIAEDQLVPADDDRQRFSLAALANHSSPAPAAMSAHPAAQQAMAHNVSQQLARAAANTSDGAVELTLAPEELGKVRMVMQHSDGGMSVMIYADRPETLDLMRRHAEILSRDLRELGYTDVNLNFADQRQNGQNAQDLAEQAERIRNERGPQPSFNTGSIANTLNASRTSGSVLGGLDLRM